MKIRKAKESDNNRILELLNQNSGNSGDDNLHYEMKHILEFIKGKAFETFVYEENGRVIGVVMANVFPIAEYAEMYNIAVDSKHREKGIGIKLGRFLEEHLKKIGIEFAYAYVNDDNKISQKFSEKEGYNKGKKTWFYSKSLK